MCITLVLIHFTRIKVSVSVLNFLLGKCVIHCLNLGPLGIATAHALVGHDSRGLWLELLEIVKHCVVLDVWRWNFLILERSG